MGFDVSFVMAETLTGDHAVVWDMTEEFNLLAAIDTAQPACPTLNTPGQRVVGVSTRKTLQRAIGVYHSSFQQPRLDELTLSIHTLTP